MKAEPWAVVLGSSSGSGAAIASALGRDPGLNIFGVHRGNHVESAAAVAASVTGAGRRMHERIADAGKVENVASGVDEVLAVAGPKSVHMFVHSLANASIGYLAKAPPARPGETPQLLHSKQIDKTFQSMAH
jgi:NAD(P)-dependent dehydrogenase (short-subunit alcohol dehydrogenase family)